MKDALFSKRESRGKEGSQTGWGGRELISSPPCRWTGHDGTTASFGVLRPGATMATAALAPTLSGDSRRRWHQPCQGTAAASMGRDGCRLHSGPVHAVAAQQLMSGLYGGRGGADAVLVSGWRQHHRGVTVVTAASPHFSASCSWARGGPRWS